MHVLILNQYALPAGSAGITRHGDIGAELVRRGHEVTVIASDYDYLRRTPGTRRASEELTRDGVRFVWLRTGSYTKNDSGRVKSMLRYGYRAAIAAVRVEPRPDVIVGSSPHLLAPLAAAVAARWLRVPWVMEVRDFWPAALVDLGALRSGSLTHRMLQRLERRLYSSSARIVSVPPNGACRMTELGLDPGKVVHVPNGVHPEPDTRELPETLNTILSDVDDQFVIGYTGAIGMAHDLETALLGMAELSATDAAATLLLVGDGVKRAPLMQVASRQALTNVHFHPAIDKATIPALLHRCDACLMQAGNADYFKYGLSPNKLFDYFAAGKPVLIASAHPTVVEEAGAGIRFQPGDPGAFADAVRRLRSLSPEERREMGRRGQELARTTYSIQAIADRYEQVLREVVAPGAS